MRRTIMVHDTVTKLHKAIPSQRLGQEVSNVVIRANVGHDDPAVLNHLSNPEMAPIDMFGSIMMLRVVAKRLSACVVGSEGDRGRIRFAEVCEKVG